MRCNDYIEVEKRNKKEDALIERWVSERHPIRLDLAQSNKTDLGIV